MIYKYVWVIDCTQHYNKCLVLKNRELEIYVGDVMV